MDSDLSPWLQDTETSVSCKIHLTAEFLIVWRRTTQKDKLFHKTTRNNEKVENFQKKNQVSTVHHTNALLIVLSLSPPIMLESLVSATFSLTSQKQECVGSRKQSTSQWDVVMEGSVAAVGPHWKAGRPIRPVRPVRPACSATMLRRRAVVLPHKRPLRI